jgi:hypothetical protein
MSLPADLPATLGDQTPLSSPVTPLPAPDPPSMPMMPGTGIGLAFSPLPPPLPAPEHPSMPMMPGTGIGLAFTPPPEEPPPEERAFGTAGTARRSWGSRRTGGRSSPATARSASATRSSSPTPRCGGSARTAAVIGGFAGATADAFTLFERLEKKLEQYNGQLLRARSSSPRTGGPTNIFAISKR